MLATAVAETSLTVPGVRVVVDSGLARVARIDHGRGLGGLVTVPVSRADRRTARRPRRPGGARARLPVLAGRARTNGSPAQPEPEVATADLTGFALHLACWGDPDGSGLALLDAPPPTAMRLARESLTTLGAVDDTGRATARGRAMAATGAHPRLARALLDGAAEVGTDRAVEIVALLSEEVVRPRGRPRRRLARPCAPAVIRPRPRGGGPRSAGCAPPCRPRRARRRPELPDDLAAGAGGGAGVPGAAGPGPATRRGRPT